MVILNESKTERLQALADLISSISEACAVSNEVARTCPLININDAQDICSLAVFQIKNILNEDDHE